MIGNGSVMHMGYCFLGLGVCSSLGASATIMLMCAHGLSVSLMFLVANFINQRTSTLDMDEMGGWLLKLLFLRVFLQPPLLQPSDCLVLEISGVNLQFSSL